MSGTTVTAAYYNLTETTETGVYTQGDGANAVTFSNSSSTTTTSVRVEKVWEDNDNELGLRPNNISVDLVYTYTGNTEGVTYDTKTLTGTSNTWSYTWDELPTYINGYAVTWSVKETSSLSYYTSSEPVAATDADGNVTYTITNTLTVAELSITKKVVDPNSYATSTTFTFTVSGFSTIGETVTVVIDGVTTKYTVDEANSITFTLSGGETATIQYVPTDASLSATYTVEEGDSTSWNTTYSVDGGTATAGTTATVKVDAGTTTNVTYTNTITGNASIAITKNWIDYSNEYLTRPDNNGTSFTVTLTPVIATTVDEVTTYSLDTSSAITTSGTWTEGSDTWTITLENVPVYDENGNAITYAITETDLSSLNYSMAVSGYSGTVTVDGTNYYTPLPATRPLKSPTRLIQRP